MIGCNRPAGDDRTVCPVANRILVRDPRPVAMLARILSAAETEEMGIRQDRRDNAAMFGAKEC